MKEAMQITGKVTMTFTNVITGEKRVKTYCNRVVNSGKAMLAARLAGGSNACDVTYMAVGTGAPTAPATGPDGTDTALWTELYRKLITLRSASGSVAHTSTYFGTGEANGTLTEVGMFGEDASATPGSGTMYNHAEIDETKNSSETLTIECDVTFA